MDQDFRNMIAARVAERTGKSKEVIDKIAAFQYKELYRRMTNENVRSVLVNGLGLFRIKQVKMARMMGRLYEKIEVLQRRVDSGTYLKRRVGSMRASIMIQKDMIDYMKKRLMKIDLKGIMEGVRNSLFIKEEVEKIAADRLLVCKYCPHNSDWQKWKNNYKTFRPDYHCTICGCDLHLKTRSLSSSCPMDRWPAQVTEEQEQEIKRKIDENSSD